LAQNTTPAKQTQS